MTERKRNLLGRLIFLYANPFPRVGASGIGRRHDRRVRILHKLLAEAGMERRGKMPQYIPASCATGTFVADFDKDGNIMAIDLVGLSPLRI